MKPATAAVFVALMLLAPAAHAMDATAWDAMPSPVNGSIKIKTNAGKTFTGHWATFLPTEVSLDSGETVSREEVKELTVRGPRSRCCDPLWFAAGGMLLGRAAVADGYVVEGIIVIVFFTPAAAVTLPPAIAIEGVRRLIPAKVLYKVSP